MCLVTKTMIQVPNSTGRRKRSSKWTTSPRFSGRSTRIQLHVLPHFRREFSKVWLGNRKLSSHQLSTFFDHIHGRTILHWHASHHRFPACYARHIDWYVCAAAIKRLALGRRRWVAKHTSGVCAEGSQLVRWKEQPTLDCPRCGEQENARHVWTCQEPAVFFVWALLMFAFSKWLESVHTAKGVTYWIIQRLT